MTTPTPTPTLRFPGFTGEWEKRRLEEVVSEFKSGSGITSDEIRENGPYPVYGGNGLRGYSGEYTHEGFYCLIGRQGALCGNINKTTGKAYISEHAIAVQANDNNDTEWLAQRLEFQNLNRLSESSAQPGLSVKKLLRFNKIYFPTFHEQQKIAAFLRAVDARAALLRRQVEALDAYKRGVMQRVFDRDVRFGTGDWETVRLREVVKSLSSGVSVNSNDVAASNAEFGILKTSCVAQGSFLPIENKTVLPTEENRLKCPVKADTIIISRMNTPQLVGESGLVDRDYDNLFLPDRLWAAEIDKAAAVPKYISYVLISDRIRFRLTAIATGTSGSMKNISQPNFLNLKISLPPLPEQRRIAAFLGALDARIAGVRRQVEKVGDFKRGCLGELFV